VTCTSFNHLPTHLNN